MPQLFQSQPGQVVVVDIPDVNVAGLANLVVQTSGGYSTPLVRSNGLIITGLANAQQDNSQYRHSLDRKIYVYSFGSDIGDIQMHGYAFWQSCGNGVENAPSGIDSLIEFYNNYRVGNMTNSTSSTTGNQFSVQVQMSQQNITGFLYGMQMEVSNAETLLTSFVLHIKTMPSG